MTLARDAGDYAMKRTDEHRIRFGVISDSTY